MMISPPKDRFAHARTARDLYGRLVERLRAVPGVEEAALVNFMPTGGADFLHGWKFPDARRTAMTSRCT
jgi:hypothetical protein